ncbi:MAG TPA: right-handed parallel beta-helix repeat-containing protein [Tepidisphaeraceae bacterium]|nr:right-handed parallel beta-helix repeat-containing protein [Tepidisphaeraceae bacterium]
MSKLWVAMVIVLVGMTLPAGASTYYVTPSGNDGSAGSVDTPWRTLQRGASALRPGDTLLIAAGIYREAITLKTSGTAESPITLAAMPGARVIITGADRLENGWAKVAGTADPVFVHDWPHLFPIGHTQGKPILTHPGDKEHELTGRAEQVIHEGRLLRQVLRRDQVAPGTFFVDIDNKKLLVWLRDGGDPSKTELEASTRTQWLAGEPGVSYIHVRGITFRYAANHAQRGAFVIGQSHGGNPRTISRGWVVEDCVFEKANSSGGSFAGESHLFRRCVFQDNGQLGFGTSFCHNTVMEECGVYRNNTKGYSTGWEAGGLKVTFSRGFVFNRCRVMDNRGCGIWYDIGNEKSEVKNCYIANNDESGIFYEISYGLHAHDNLIVNNANRGEHVGGAWGTGGVTLSSSEGCTIEYNTMVGNRDGIAFREQDRSTPRIDDSRKDFRILNRDHVLRNNVVAYSQAYNVALWMDTNFFGPHPGGGDANRPIFENPATLNIRFENNLLWPIAGRPNYLYGAPWRSKSKQFKSPTEFAQSSGVSDTSRVGDPLFTDVVAGDYRLREDSPAKTMNAGMRSDIRP